MRTGRSRTRTIAAAAFLLLSCLVAGGPAAHAVFTATASAGAFTASTHVLAAPAGNIVTATCLPIGNSGKYRLDITVVSHGTVPKANAYVLTATDPAGQNRYSVNLAPGGRYSSTTAAAGKWTYSVDAQYRVTGSTNAWSSKSQPVSVYC